MAFFSLFFWFCCIFHSLLVVLQSCNTWIVQEGISLCSQSSPKVRPRVSLLLSLSLSFLLCLFAKSVVTRMTSKHNFIEKSFSLCFLFFFPTIFSSFLKITKWFLPWILVGRKDGRCAHKSRWSQKSTVSKRCFSYRFSYIALLCDPDDVHPLEIKPKSA